jgi:hypothetical protein
MPIPLRSDFDAAQLRGVARRTKDAPRSRRWTESPTSALNSALARPAGRKNSRPGGKGEK